jgi:hypothetical protein
VEVAVAHSHYKYARALVRLLNVNNVNLLGTRFEARNYICEPGPQEPHTVTYNYLKTHRLHYTGCILYAFRTSQLCNKANYVNSGRTETQRQGKTYPIRPYYDTQHWIKYVGDPTALLFMTASCHRLPERRIWRMSSNSIYVSGSGDDYWRYLRIRRTSYFAHILTLKTKLWLFSVRIRYFLTKHISFGWFTSIIPK